MVETPPTSILIGPHVLFNILNSKGPRATNLSATNHTVIDNAGGEGRAVTMKDTGTEVCTL